MVAKKDLVIVALATFCLTVSLFMILPTKSNPGGYDAWNDLNDDGRIDIFDAIKFADTFNTAGDPTKNVNVTNWPLDPFGNLKVSFTRATNDGTWSGMTHPEEGALLDISTRGYDRITICMDSNGTVMVSPSWSISGGYYVSESPVNLTGVATVKYQIQGQTLELVFVGQSMEDSYEVNAAYYLTA